MEDIILKRAKETSKKENKLAYILAKNLVAKRMQKMAFLVYYFLRWIDDALDQGYLTKRQKLKFLRKEKKAIENIFSDKKIAKNLNEYETCILLMKKLDSKVAYKMKKYVLDTYLTAFEFELKRPRIVTKKWLLEYAYYVGGSFANIGILVLDPDVDAKTMNGISKTVASASDLAHLLRDFRKDIRNSQINISKEDIEKFNININNMNENSQELRNFTRSQVSEIEGLFWSGEKYIKSLPNFKLKLAAALFVSKYRFVLAKIRNRDYNLFSNYDNNTLLENIMRIGIIFNDVSRLVF